MALGFGIIGCGMIASFHSRAINDVRGAKLVACFDTFPAAADRLAQSTGCRAYHDLKQMLADPEVDVVTIGTPSGAHMEPAIAAARAGKHIIVEKPLEITLRRCDKIIEGVRQGRRRPLDHFPLAIPRLQRRAEEGDRPGPFRHTGRRRRLREVVSHATVLRQRRVARHVAVRRWRRTDEPGDSQRRPVAVPDGPGC